MPNTKPSPYITALADMRRRMGYMFLVLGTAFAIIAFVIALQKGFTDLPLPVFFAAGFAISSFVIASTRFKDARETLSIRFGDEGEAA